MDMPETSGVGREAGRQPGHHYHIIENSVGYAHGYRDELFRSRKRALESARMRAQWLAGAGGCRVEKLLGPEGRYLVTDGHPRNAGHLIAVEDCDDPSWLEVAYGSMVDL